MPFTFFSHQAPVLPLKLWKPRWFSGTALVFGSMAPDFEYFWRGVPVSEMGHTPWGQVTWCVPWTLLLVWLFRRVIVGPLAAHVPELGPLRLTDYRRLGLASDGPAFWMKAGVSAWIGSWSHVLLDSATHRDGWIVEHVPALQAALPVSGRTVPVYILLNWAGTIGGAAVTLGLLASIGRQELLAPWTGTGELPPLLRPKPSELVRFWLPVGLGMAVGFSSLIWAADPTAKAFPLWLGLFLRGSLGAFLGLLLGSTRAKRI